MSQIIMNGERKEAVLVKKADVIGHDLTLLEEEQFQLPFNEQIHNVKKYTCLDNTDQRVVSFFGSSIMDNQELRYTGAFRSLSGEKQRHRERVKEGWLSIAKSG